MVPVSLRHKPGVLGARSCSTAEGAQAMADLGEGAVQWVLIPLSPHLGWSRRVSTAAGAKIALGLAWAQEQAAGAMQLREEEGAV